MIVPLPSVSILKDGRNKTRVKTRNLRKGPVQKIKNGPLSTSGGPIGDTVRDTLADGRRFLSEWGSQAEALGWTADDLFGLHEPSAKPHPSYSRLSRYDCIGLIWLLQGLPVVALTDSTAAIQNPIDGNVLSYRRFNKPALGPLGDSLDDLK